MHRAGREPKLFVLNCNRLPPPAPRRIQIAPRRSPVRARLASSRGATGGYPRSRATCPEVGRDGPCPGGSAARRSAGCRSRGAAELPGALAPGRGMGLEPLAAIRRAPPPPAAKSGADRRLAAAPRRPPQPRPDGSPQGLASEPPRGRPGSAMAGEGVHKPTDAAALAGAAYPHPGAHGAARLFHSLHQFAVPQRARFIFGVRRDRFTELRRQELSPLQIGMLYGRSPGQVQAAVIGHAARACASRGTHQVDSRRHRPSCCSPASSRRSRGGSSRRATTARPRPTTTARTAGSCQGAAQLRPQPRAVCGRRAHRLRRLRAAAAAAPALRRDERVFERAARAGRAVWFPRRC